jgi:HNH endonuclease
MAKYSQLWPADPVLWDDPEGLTGPMRNAAIRSKCRAHRELRRRVHIRDDFTCHFCGFRPLNASATYCGTYAVVRTHPEDRFLNVDHIVPRELGGLTESCNLRTLCDRCNSIKGARLDCDVPAFTAVMEPHLCLDHGVVLAFGHRPVCQCESALRSLCGLQVERLEMD